MNTPRGEPAWQTGTRLAIAAVLALALVSSAAWARPLSDQERASLETTIEGYEAAMRDGNYARLVQTVPPKVVAALARRGGTTPDHIVALITKAMQQTLQGDDIKIESFGMDLGSADHKELVSGAPYLLIPTQTVMTIGDRRLRVMSHTLGLIDGGKWFLLRINNTPHLQILLDVYPEFTSVEFPRGSMEALNP